MQQYLAVVKEINLEELVAEAEHYRVPSLKPLLDVDKLIIVHIGVFFFGKLFKLFIEVNDKPLKKKIFLLKVSIFWERFGLVGKNLLLL